MGWAQILLQFQDWVQGTVALDKRSARMVGALEY
jgi:hypothetical protein